MSRDRGPCLAIVWVDGRADLQVFAQRKQRAARKVGVEVRLHPLPSHEGEAGVLAALESIRKDPGVDGILLQYPLPQGVCLAACVEAIGSEKDIDGATAASRARFAAGDTSAAPATIRGLARLLAEHHVDLGGDSLVVGSAGAGLTAAVITWLQVTERSGQVISPRAEELERRIGEHDCVILASGGRGGAAASGFREGSLVIDLRYHSDEGAAMDLAGAAERCSAYIPARGGVGPMTTYEVLAATVARWEGRL